MKNTRKNILSALPFVSVIISGLLLMIFSAPVYADDPPLQPGCYVRDSITFTPANCANENQARSIVAPLNKCFVASGSSQGIGTFSEVNCQTGTTAAPSAAVSEEPKFVKNDCNTQPVNKNNCGIVRYIVMFINTLSVVAGVAIVGSMVYGGIQYSSAGSDPQKVSAAKNRIRNAIIALLFFLFGYGFLNYIVPGGVL